MKKEDIKTLIERLNMKEPPFINKSNINAIETSIDERIVELYYREESGTIPAHSYQDIQDIKKKLLSKIMKPRERSKKLNYVALDSLIRQIVASLGNLAANTSWKKEGKKKEVEITIYRLRGKTAGKLLVTTLFIEIGDELKFLRKYMYEGILKKLEEAGYKMDIAKEETLKMTEMTNELRMTLAKEGKFTARTEWVMRDGEMIVIQELFLHNNKIPSFLAEQAYYLDPGQGKYVKITKKFVRESIQSQRSVKFREDLVESAKKEKAEKRKNAEMNKPITKEFSIRFVKECIEKTGKYQANIKWLARKEQRHVPKSGTCKDLSVDWKPWDLVTVLITVDIMRITVYDKQSLFPRGLFSFDIEFYPEDWTSSTVYIRDFRLIPAIKENAKEHGKIFVC